MSAPEREPARQVAAGAISLGRVLALEERGIVVVYRDELEQPPAGPATGREAVPGWLLELGMRNVVVHTCLQYHRRGDLSDAGLFKTLVEALIKDSDGFKDALSKRLENAPPPVMVVKPAASSEPRVLAHGCVINWQSHDGREALLIEVTGETQIPVGQSVEIRALDDGERGR